MSRALNRIAVPLLHALDPETAHRAAVLLMRMAPPLPRKPDDGSLALDAFGLAFPNPIGLAAGFDKNAEVADAALRFGFGSTEVGTLTPRAQEGNARPRVFRLSADRAVINRYGFNNAGHAAAHGRLGKRHRGIVGVNVGANKDSDDRVADYTAGLACFADVADYFTLNISSPNTPGLRDLQATRSLDDLLARTIDTRDRLAARHGRKPLLLKIAPDLDLSGLDDVVAVARRRRIDGMIVANTTLARPATLRDPAARETGGLSGRPLFAPSTRMLAETFLRVERQFPLVGVGGIDSGATALAKIRAGASLIQLYSGLVFEGLGLVVAIKAHLTRELAAGTTSLAALTGADAEAWTRDRPPSAS